MAIRLYPQRLEAREDQGSFAHRLRGVGLMRKSISMLSTFPPTHCGIATFAQSLSDALRHHDAEVRRIALDYDGELCDGNGFAALHRGAIDTSTTARSINDAELAIIQHEFGIFSGD